MHARAAGLITVALILTAALCGCAGPPAGNQVTILVAWNTAEVAAFKSVVIKKFEAQTGIPVNVESTRALTQELDAGLSQDDPPAVAALPSIGAVSQLAGSGELKPLDGLVNTSEYGRPWSALMRQDGPHGRRHVYTVPVKVDVKSLIWYDPAKFPAGGRHVPRTWAQLLAFGKAEGESAWCLAVASPPVSGWPGADWIADILLSEYGAGTYAEWVSGNLSWTSPQVEQAWTTWNQMIASGKAVYGGPGAALTDSVGAVNPASSGCYLAHGTLVDQGFSAPWARYGVNYAFFPFPSATAAMNPIEVSADFIGMFSSTPASRALVRYLAGPAAQQAWVRQPGVDGFSANKHVPFSVYPNPVTRQQIAELLTSGRRELCFGAADAMSPELSTAFYNAVLEDLADPAALTGQILPELSKVQPGPGSTLDVCGQS